MIELRMSVRQSTRRWRLSEQKLCGSSHARSKAAENGEKLARIVESRQRERCVCGRRTSNTAVSVSFETQNNCSLLVMPGNRHDNVASPNAQHAPDVDVESVKSPEKDLTCILMQCFPHDKNRVQSHL